MTPVFCIDIFCRLYKTMATPSKEVDILIIGKTGNGKSATGNSILRKRSFVSEAAMVSVTERAQVDYSEFEGRNIKVVDGPGVGDTGYDNEEGIKIVVDALTDAIALSPLGYHAVLLVIPYGRRFTQEDVDSVQIMKRIFGETFITDHSILLLTHGDDFSAEYEDTGITFEDWCRQQEGFFAQLFQECGEKAILFNNRLRDNVRKCEQIKQLLKMIDNLEGKGQRYTSDIFNKAKETRDRLMADPASGLISEDILREYGALTKELEQVDLSDPKKDEIRLHNLQERLHRLDEEIKKSCKGSSSISVALRLFENIRGLLVAKQRAVKDMLAEQEMIQELQMRQAERKTDEAKHGESYLRGESDTEAGASQFMETGKTEIIKELGDGKRRMKSGVEEQMKQAERKTDEAKHGENYLREGESDMEAGASQFMETGKTEIRKELGDGKRRKKGGIEERKGGMQRRGQESDQFVKHEELDLLLAKYKKNHEDRMRELQQETTKLTMFYDKIKAHQTHSIKQACKDLLKTIWHAIVG